MLPMVPRQHSAHRRRLAALRAHILLPSSADAASPRPTWSICRRAASSSTSTMATSMPQHATTARTAAPDCVISTDRPSADLATIRYNLATVRRFPPSASLPFRARAPVHGDSSAGPHGHLQLHVFLPAVERLAGTTAARTRAAAVCLSEGGWRATEATQFFPQCAAMAAAGVVAVAVGARARGRTPLALASPLHGCWEHCPL
jgi:hypothetical protein